MKTILSFLQDMTSGRLLAAWVLALLGGLTLSLVGLGEDVERQLSNARAEIMEKPASGQVVIVEIDAKSMQAIERWPWPREYYARAVDRLNDAGVSQIAFDIDFSARSTEAQDRIFADAIDRSAATIILPTFRQRASDERLEFVESLPLDILRKNAFLSSVNIHPDDLGQLNQYSFGTTTAGIARPSLASLIAEVAGNIDDSFAIDQTIDPATIPRVSFVDLIDTNTPVSVLQGKKILVGATAIELGDRYPLSRFGVVPGVVIQAMASETLIQGSSLSSVGAVPAVIVVAMLLFISIVSGKISSEGLIRIAFLLFLTLTSILFLVEYLDLFTFSIVPAILFLTAYMALQKFLNTEKALNTSKYINAISGLPNELVMLKDIAAAPFDYIITARISDFRELLVLTNDISRQDLFRNIASRLNFLARDEQIYHVDSDMLAWIVKKEYCDDIPGHFATASALLQAPVMAEQTRLKISSTFGISGEGLEKSRIASEQAYATGKKWAWHDQEFDEAIGQKHDLLVELDQAIEAGRLGVVYQPKWDLKSNQLDGAEALVRWSHPERGIISPAIFIPMLENAGRIDGLTYFVLGQALDDVARWGVRRSGLTCSVNISARLLGDTSFVATAIGMIDRSSVDNRQIVFEVTETATMADPEQCIAALNLIRDAGIRISIDDYGTGQSTMSYLQRLPVNEIKLDQSFVKTMITDKANRVMVQSTIKMAHALGLKIVAEGIEDKPCMALLARYGCDVGQGWHISRPVAPDIFESDWLESGIEVRRLSA